MCASPVPGHRAAASSRSPRHASRPGVRQGGRPPHRGRPTRPSLSDTFPCFHSIAGET
ncbi:MAG: hypothetical protein MZV64_17210 [Ignavibacteriales bacterium]|nr:hypothetical protein [Ignavibacteriales bacterium]